MSGSSITKPNDSEEEIDYPHDFNHRRVPIVSNGPPGGRRHSFAAVKHIYGNKSLKGNPVIGILPPVSLSELTNENHVPYGSSIFVSPSRSSILWKGSNAVADSKEEKVPNKEQIIKEQPPIKEISTVEQGFHPISLVFLDPDMENQYQMFFLKRSLFILKKNVMVIFSLYTAMYIYFFVSIPQSSNSWKTQYSDLMKGSVTLETIDQKCPSGWYCLSCDVTQSCGEYNLRNDVILWALGGLLPSIMVMILLTKLNESLLAKRVHFISAVYCAWVTSIGSLARFSLVNTTSPDWNRGLLTLISASGTLMLMRVRFLDSVWSSSVVTMASIIAYSNLLVVNSSKRIGVSLSATVAFPATIGAILSFICMACHDNEIAIKRQFLASQTLQKDNKKLINQLTTLHQRYDSRAAELHSPLQKSMMLLLSLQSDPTCTSSQVSTLAEIYKHLSSGNIMTPDIESHASESLDNDQKAWLFAEIMPNRRRNTIIDTSTGNKHRTADKIQRIASESNSASLSKRVATINDARRKSRVPSFVPTLSFMSLAPDEDESTPIHNPEFKIAIGTAVHADNSRDEVSKKDQSNNHADLAKEGSCAITVNSDFGLPTGDTILSMIKIPGICEILEKSSSYNWNVFELATLTNNKPLSTLSCYLFDKLGLFNRFKIPMNKFWNFITSIEAGYRSDLPYHNATHAADVLHCIYYMSQTERIANVVTLHDLMTLFLAAIIHDYDHPGVNNNFLINTYDTRAILYNDKSILENHHLASAFAILAKEDCNFINSLSKQEFKSMREVVIEMVFATDLSQHFILLSEFKAKCTQEFNPLEVVEDKLLLFRLLIKISDVSNPTKDWDIYHRWCELVLDEFMSQGDKEKALGIPVSPYMDRDSLNIPSSQIGFIDYVIIPLFEAYEKFDSNPSAMTTLLSNKERWMELRASTDVKKPPTVFHRTSTVNNISRWNQSSKSNLLLDRSSSSKQNFRKGNVEGSLSSIATSLLVSTRATMRAVTGMNEETVTGNINVTVEPQRNGTGDNSI